jgi:hypothetical protein
MMVTTYCKTSASSSPQQAPSGRMCLLCWFVSEISESSSRLVAVVVVVVVSIILQSAGTFEIWTRNKLISQMANSEPTDND